MTNRTDHKHKQLLIQLQENRQSLEWRVDVIYKQQSAVNKLKILSMLRAYENQVELNDLFVRLFPSPDYLRELYWLVQMQHNKFQFGYMSNTTLKRCVSNNKAFNHFITFARKHLKMSLVDTFKFLCLINK